MNDTDDLFGLIAALSPHDRLRLRDDLRAGRMRANLPGWVESFDVQEQGEYSPYGCGGRLVRHNMKARVVLTREIPYLGARVPEELVIVTPTVEAEYRLLSKGPRR
jgi:hypothetical protein